MSVLVVSEIAGDGVAPQTLNAVTAALAIDGDVHVLVAGENCGAQAEAAAKIAAFAYDRETRTPLWQSGVNSSLATAKDTWVLGVGPFQGGTIDIHAVGGNRRVTRERLER